MKDPATTATRRSGAGSTSWTAVFAALAIAVAVVLSLIGYGSNDEGSSTSGVLVIPLACLAMAPLIRWVARAEDRPELVPLLWLSLGLHLVGAVFRMRAASDSLEYHREGTALAVLFRDGQFVVDTGRPVPGTGTMRYLTGLVHVLTGSTMFATLVVFTTLSFVALVIYLRAFSRGVPGGDRRRYALLLLLWPSLLFWPSSIGKESWMTFTMSVAALGAARWFTHRRGALPLLGLGLFGTFMVRPHVALILVIAVGVAFLFRAPTEGSQVKVASKLVGIVLLLVVGGILATRTAEFLGVENLATEGVDQALSEVGQQTTQGGAEFEPARVTNPLAYPWAAFTVLVRPLPFEVSNVEGMVSAIEGMVLLGIVVVSWRRMLTVPRLSVTVSYVALALAFTAMFVFAFAVIGNFGILARQRTQVLPFLFVLVSIPVVGHREHRSAARSLRAAGARSRATAGEHHDHEPAHHRRPTWRSNALWVPDDEGIAQRNAGAPRPRRPARRARPGTVGRAPSAEPSPR